MRKQENSTQKNKGVFIAIEGIDGAGKTTIAKLLAEKLKEQGREVILTKEPRDPCITKHIDNITKRGGNPIAEALLFAADRMIHYTNIIKPALEKGDVIISDRYKLSSIVYQSVRGAPRSWVEEVNRYAPEPDITIILDIPVEEALKRLMKKQNKRLTGLERQDKLEKIRETYLEIAEEKGYLVINGMLPPQEIIEKIYRAISTNVEIEKDWEV
ncbi:MAG: dTMP kinase [Desulfurococcales archaeon]|nr:dTMP kinase [Desulfurococcales archaeon]